jgi:hypothetical protein
MIVNLPPYFGMSADGGLAARVVVAADSVIDGGGLNVGEFVEMEGLQDIQRARTRMSPKAVRPNFLCISIPPCVLRCIGPTKGQAVTKSGEAQVSRMIVSNANTLPYGRQHRELPHNNCYRRRYGCVDNRVTGRR